jgi:hypothetical protein
MCYDRRLARFCEIHSRSCRDDATLPQGGDGILDSIGAHIGYVIAGQRGDVKPSVFQGRQVVRIAGRSRDVGGVFASAACMRDLNVPNQQISLLQDTARGFEK